MQNKKIKTAKRIQWFRAWFSEWANWFKKVISAKEIMLGLVLSAIAVAVLLRQGYLTMAWDELVTQYAGLIALLIVAVLWVLFSAVVSAFTVKNRMASVGQWSDSGYWYHKPVLVDSFVLSKSGSTERVVKIKELPIDDVVVYFSIKHTSADNLIGWDVYGTCRVMIKINGEKSWGTKKSKRGVRVSNKTVTFEWQKQPGADPVLVQCFMTKWSVK